MKRKKLCLATALSLLFSVGCGRVFIPPLPPSDSNDVKTATFTVKYDYGMHIEGRVTTLLDGSLVFFKAEDYGVAPLLAGEEVTVTYTGELLILESYPGVVRFEGGELKNVEKTRHAQIAGDCYRDGESLCEEYGHWFSEVAKEDIPEYVAHADGSFTPFDEISEETELFVAFVLALPWQENADVNPDMKRIPPTALYSYNPYARE